MNYKTVIFEKIANNDLVVGIFGLGYVGLPLATSFAQSNVKVIGFDKNPEKVKKVNLGENNIKDINAND